MQTNNNEKKKDKKNRMSFDVYLDISEISNANKTNMTRMVACDHSVVCCMPNAIILVGMVCVSHTTLPIKTAIKINVESLVQEPSLLQHRELVFLMTRKRLVPRINKEK